MIYVHLAEGFEEIEALATVDVLRRAEIEAKLVSVTGERVVTGAHGIQTVADLLFEEGDYEQAKMIVLPGGMPGTTNLMAHKGLTTQILRYAADENKWVAAICAAPMILGHLSLLEGREATIYSGMEEHLRGAKHSSEKVVVDGRIITSKGPGTALAFALKLVEILKDAETAARIGKSMLL